MKNLRRGGLVHTEVPSVLSAVIPPPVPDVRSSEFIEGRFRQQAGGEAPEEKISVKVYPITVTLICKYISKLSS